MKRFMLAVVVIASLLLAFVGPASATPPGNDGDPCHGANQETCRPDPQPSNGQDCLPHGNNPDGNDDHCASLTPSPETSESPSSEPSVEPSQTPDATIPPSSSPSSTPTTTPTPSASLVSTTSPKTTLPPTDTVPADASSTGSNTGFIRFLLFVVALVAAVAYMTTGIKRGNHE